MRYTPNKSEKELFQIVSLLETPDEAKKFLRDLLTEPELKEFANRWKVAQMLNKKVPYKNIERETLMSSTTIARVQRYLTNGMGGYKNMLKKLNINVTHHATPPLTAV